MTRWLDGQMAGRPDKWTTRHLDDQTSGELDEQTTRRSIAVPKCSIHDQLIDC